MRISDWSSDVCSSDLRVFSVFTDEGDRLLKEGVNPIIIENLARQIGMPVGPLAVQDEVMMDMLLRSFKANQALDAELGDDYARTYEVCGELCELMSSRGRPGRGASAGFYDYFADGSKALRSEEHTSEIQSLMANAVAGFCFKKKK